MTTAKRAGRGKGGGGGYAGFDDVCSHQDIDAHGLPEGEEDNRLDDQKLGEGSDGLQLVVAGRVHQDQAVQRPTLQGPNLMRMYD